MIKVMIKAMKINSTNVKQMKFLSLKHFFLTCRKIEGTEKLKKSYDKDICC
jgi:hypothetical protein